MSHAKRARAMLGALYLSMVRQEAGDYDGAAEAISGALDQFEDEAFARQHLGNLADIAVALHYAAKSEAALIGTACDAVAQVHSRAVTLLGRYGQPEPQYERYAATVRRSVLGST